MRLLGGGIEAVVLHLGGTTLEVGIATVGKARAAAGGAPKVSAVAGVGVGLGIAASACPAAGEGLELVSLGLIGHHAGYTW